LPLPPPIFEAGPPTFVRGLGFIATSGDLPICNGLVKGFTAGVTGGDTLPLPAFLPAFLPLPPPIFEAGPPTFVRGLGFIATSGDLPICNGLVNGLGWSNGLVCGLTAGDALPAFLPFPAFLPLPLPFGGGATG